MSSSIRWVFGAMLVVSSARAVMADDVRYYDENGITYRETRQTVKRPVPQTRLENHETIQYREKYSTDLQDVQRVYQVPVTEYQWETQMAGRWNPFSQPYLTYRLVPKTRMETKVETVKIPVTKREVVPEKITHQVPITTHLMAEESVVHRVAVGPTNNANSAVASGNHYDSATASTLNGTPGTLSNDSVGGVSKLDSGLPKQSPDWRSGDSTLRR